MNEEKIPLEKICKTFVSEEITKDVRKKKSRDRNCELNLHLKNKQQKVE